MYPFIVSYLVHEHQKLEEESKGFRGDLQIKKKEQDMYVLLHETQGENTSLYYLMKPPGFILSPAALLT